MKERTLRYGPVVTDSILLLLMGALLVVVTAWSADWRVEHDAPIMLYQALLMEEFGYLPYRDFFDMNLPGTYLAYGLVGRFLGYGDTVLRYFDWALLLAVLIPMAIVLKDLSWRSAALGMVLYGLRYFDLGPDVTLQREELALLPVGLGVVAATRTRWPIVTRAVLAGLLFGIASTVKPHLSVGLVPVVAYLASEIPYGPDRRRSLVPALAAGFAGWATPLMLMVVGLLALGLWKDFLHSLAYLPYYGAMTGKHVVVEGWDRVAYLFDRVTNMAGYQRWVLAGLCGAMLARSGTPDAPKKRLVALVGGMSVAFVLYPAGSGQFWPYHWLPMHYWTCAAVGLLLAPGSARWMEWAGRVAAWWLCFWASDVTAAFERFEEDNPRVKKGRPDEIAAFLQEHLREGDRVQILDWAKVGVAHAMLLARARPATEFLYSFHFYHHVSTPYIQALRAEFLEQFDAANPPYVIEGRRSATEPWVTGPDTVTEFPELDQRLEERYTKAVDESMYTIWERKDRSAELGRPEYAKDRSAPNVLLLTVDTLRADYLSRAGYDRPTSPTLDALVAQGVSFENALTPMARTTPAVASLLTGLYPQTHGVRTLYGALGTSHLTIAEVARARGYHTIAVVSNHLLKEERGLDAGFEVYDPSGDGRVASKTTSDALKHAKKVPKDEPMFLWVHYIDPHVPYHPWKSHARTFDPGWTGKYADAFGSTVGAVGTKAYPEDLGKELAVFANPLTDEENAHVRRLYAADILQVDLAVKTLLASLRKTRGDNWVVVFTADHGEALGEHDFFYDHGDYVWLPELHVPLAFVDLRNPLPEPVSVGRRVSLVDVAPTLSAWLGWQGNETEGRSLLPAFRGEPLPDVPVFAECGESFFPHRIRRRVDFTTKGRFRTALFGDLKVIYTPGVSEDEAWELYDLAVDPGETTNLWPAQKDRAETLVAALLSWMGDDPESDAPPPTAEDLQLLKSLGYLE